MHAEAPPPYALHFFIVFFFYSLFLFTLLIYLRVFVCVCCSVLVQVANFGFDLDFVVSLLLLWLVLLLPPLHEPNNCFFVTYLQRTVEFYQEDNIAVKTLQFIFIFLFHFSLN